MGWGGYGGGYGGWGEYVSVREKIANGRQAAAALAKKQNRSPQPIELKTKKIATTFWGKAWCDNLDSYSDLSNRLSRGSTYVRNGSVADLIIKSKRVEAIVAGREAYSVVIEITALSSSDWKAIKRDCSEEIDSLLDLLAGKLSDGVMKRLTKQREGLFPQPKEIKMRCSCPDDAYVCKHIAAVMYGVGSRLDTHPELLFVLRDVDHKELVTQAVAEGNLERELTSDTSALAGEDLGALFGIELDSLPETVTNASAAPKKKSAVKKSAAKQVATKKSAAKKTRPKKAATKKAAVKKSVAKKSRTATRN